MSENLLHNRSVVSLLEKLGLSKNEVKCYLASLILGQAAISEVAAVARMNRANAYGAIKTLHEKGLIEQEINKKGRRVYPTPLEHLLEFSRDYQKRATRLRWKIEDLVPTLLAASSKRADGIDFAGVSVFRGDEGFEKIAERSLSVPKGSMNYYVETLDFFHPESNPGYDEEYYIPMRMKRGILLRVLSGRNVHGQRLCAYDRKEMRETKLLSPHIKFPCAIFIYGDEVAFIWKQEETVGIAIHGSPIVAVMKMLFEMAWEMT